MIVNVVPDLGKSKLDSPHFSLVLQAISTNNLEPIHRRWVSISYANVGKKSNVTLQLAVTTYSLVSLSFSKALLGFLEVFVSKQRNDESHKVTLTIRVCLAHSGI